MSSLRPVVWLTTAWCLSACPAPADINSATTADTSAANRAIDELQAHVASACECSETSCMARALERIDKHVDKHTKASVSAAQVRRVKAQLEHLETCVRDARAKTDRLDGLAAAVAARCACTADDAGCATRAEEGFRVALESATALALKTHEQVVKRSLQFEFMECQARTLPGPPGASSRSRVRGRLARWQDLPRSIDASKHFQQMAMRLGLSFIDELWDLSPEDIFRAFPRSESGEFNDLEPWGSRIRLRLGNVDLRGINLVLEWRFMEGRLFMIVAEMKRTSRRLPEQLSLIHI